MPDWVVSLDHEKAANSKGTRSYEVHWTIKAPLEISPGVAMNAYTVGSHASLPEIGSLHHVDTSAFCIDFEVAGGKGQWSATAKYSQDQIIKQDPTEDDVVFEFDSEAYDEAIYKDIHNKAIANSAGDYYVDPVPTRENTHLIFKVTANFSSWQSWLLPASLGGLGDAVNSATVNILGLAVPAGHCKVKRPHGGKKSFRNDTVFYPHSFELHVHSLPWRLQPLDAGFRERNYEGQLIQIKNAGDDTEPTAPVPLDGSGSRMDDPQPDSVVFGDHEIYIEGDLTTLPGVS